MVIGMIIKGNFLFMENINSLRIIENGYMLVEDGIIKNVCTELPEEHTQANICDYGDKLIIPGMTDLHVHAPQYAFRGLGMDKELLEWLDEYTFPEEKNYAELEYANKAYNIFAEDMLESFTTRACIFGTIHKEADLLLAKKLDSMGLVTYVGKVNMDRNSSKELNEDTEQSLEDTIWYIDKVLEQCTYTKPIITPRFVPTCTDEIMDGLGKLQKKYELPVQSHLSENLSEIDWVAELNTESKNYGDAYDMFGLFGDSGKCIMAHCVYSPEEEQDLMKQNGVFVAHCPNSNINLASGIAPVRKYLDKGIKVGLGTDVAGGFSISMMRAIQDAVAVSKLYWRIKDQTAKPLTIWEAFYLATMGGGEFFGKVGSFLPGYEADILVLDDSRYKSPQKLDCKTRLERLCYLADTDTVCAKYVQGRLIYNRKQNGEK